MYYGIYVPSMPPLLQGLNCARFDESKMHIYRKMVTLHYDIYVTQVLANCKRLSCSRVGMVPSEVKVESI
jgi:hypothetical protein